MRTDIVILKIDDGRPHDIANYRVLAENEAGKDETQCNVFITPVSSIDETPFINPEVFRNLENKPRKPDESPEDAALKAKPWLDVRSLSDQTCMEGETTSFTCEIKGYPIPEVYLNQHRLHKSNEITVLMILRLSGKKMVHHLFTLNDSLPNIL